MRMLHGPDALPILELFDPEYLNHLLDTVLELSDKVGGIDNDQLTLVCLADGSEFYSWWLKLLLVRLDSLAEPLLSATHGAFMLFIRLLAVVKCDDGLLIECLAGL